MVKNEEIAAKAILHNMSLDAKFDDVYSKVDGLSLQNLFFCKNRYFPYCDMFTQLREDADSHFDTTGLLKALKEHYKDSKYYTVVYRNCNLTDGEIKLGFSIIIEDKNIFARFEDSVSESYILYGDGDEEALEEIEEIVKKYYVLPKQKLNNVKLIISTQTGFDLIDFEIDTVEDFNIDEQYNDNFKREAEKIEEFISAKKKSGIIILHGEKGTGKSTYISNLVKTHPDKQFIYFPSSLVPLLGQPSFTSFLARFKDSILILEDCEDALKSRNDFNSNSPVNLLLNLADGLLKSLGVKFICTFNAEVDQIDDALLRKGRLISKYEFTKLSADKSSALLTKIRGEKTVVDKALSLADIYNYEEDSYETETNKKIIGFIDE